MKNTKDYFTDEVCANLENALASIQIVKGLLELTTLEDRDNYIGEYWKAQVIEDQLDALKTQCEQYAKEPWRKFQRA